MSPPLCKKPRENNVQTATKAEEDSVSDSDSNQESLSGEEEEEVTRNLSYRIEIFFYLLIYRQIAVIN